jgi:ABC-type transport system substrate-binding protein
MAVWPPGEPGARTRKGHVVTSQPIRRRTFLSVALASAASAVAACGFSGGDEPTAGTSGTSTGGGAATGSGSAGSGGASTASGSGGAPSSGLEVASGTLRQSMVPVPHLDPAISGSGSASGNILQAGVLEGLVVSDADDGSNVLPGVAESWAISDDQKVYTFTLREDAKWSNGDQVTADDFVWNWERGLNPKTKGEGASSFNIFSGVVGAADYLSGKSTDFSTVGVKAKDATTLEISLEQPDPNLLGLLTQWRALPLHPATVQANPTNWLDPKVWVGNGAFTVASWRANAGCTLVRNEHYWDTASYPIDRWEVSFNDGGDTAQMISYQADEIDLFRVEADLGMVTSDPALKAELAISKTTQWRCLVLMNSLNPTLEDVRVRKALSLAIDRNALAQLAAPDLPGPTLVPDGITGYDKVPGTPFDPDQAQQLLADAGFAGGKGLPTINFLLPRPAPWVEAVGQMWKEHLGVSTAVDLVEVGVYTKRRQEVQQADYIGFSYGNFGINPATLFQAATMSVAQGFDIFGMKGAGAQEYRKVSADASMDPDAKQAKLDQLHKDNIFPEMARYLDLVERARAELDPDKRDSLLIETAIAREESYVALPVLWGGYNIMVKPRVKNLHVTPYPEVFLLRGTSVQA